MEVVLIPPDLKILFKRMCSNHIFSNLKGAGPHLTLLVSNNTGQWSEVTRDRANCLASEKTSSHPVENKNLSNLHQMAFSLLLDQVNSAFWRTGSQRFVSVMKLLKSIILRFCLLPLDFSSAKRTTLKSPPMHHLEPHKPYKPANSSQKHLLSLLLLIHYCI